MEIKVPDDAEKCPGDLALTRPTLGGHMLDLLHDDGILADGDTWLPDDTPSENRQPGAAALPHYNCDSWQSAALGLDSLYDSGLQHETLSCPTIQHSSASSPSYLHDTSSSPGNCFPGLRLGTETRGELRTPSPNSSLEDSFMLPFFTPVKDGKQVGYQPQPVRGDDPTLAVMNHISNHGCAFNSSFFPELASVTEEDQASSVSPVQLSGCQADFLTANTNQPHFSKCAFGSVDESVSPLRELEMHLPVKNNSFDQVPETNMNLEEEEEVLRYLAAHSPPNLLSQSSSLPEPISTETHSLAQCLGESGTTTTQCFEQPVEVPLQASYNSTEDNGQNMAKRGREAGPADEMGLCEALQNHIKRQRILQDMSPYAALNTGELSAKPLTPPGGAAAWSESVTVPGQCSMYSLDRTSVQVSLHTSGQNTEHESTAGSVPCRSTSFQLPGSVSVSVQSRLTPSQEVPQQAPGSNWTVPLLIGQPQLLPRHLAALQMKGHDVSDGRSEKPFRSTACSPHVGYPTGQPGTTLDQNGLVPMGCAATWRPVPVSSTAEVCSSNPALTVSGSGVIEAWTFAVPVTQAAAGIGLPTGLGHHAGQQGSDSGPSQTMGPMLSHQTHSTEHNLIKLSRSLARLFPQFYPSNTNGFKSIPRCQMEASKVTTQTCVPLYSAVETHPVCMSSNTGGNVCKPSIPDACKSGTVVLPTATAASQVITKEAVGMASAPMVPSSRSVAATGSPRPLVTPPSVLREQRLQPLTGAWLYMAQQKSARVIAAPPGKPRQQWVLEFFNSV